MQSWFSKQKLVRRNKMLKIEKIAVNHGSVIVEKEINGQPVFFNMHVSYRKTEAEIKSVTLRSQQYDFAKYKELADSFGYPLDFTDVTDFALAKFIEADNIEKEERRLAEIEQRKARWTNDYLINTIAPLLEKEGFVVGKPDYELWLGNGYSSDTWLTVKFHGETISINNRNKGYEVYLDWKDKARVHKTESIIEKVKYFATVITNKKQAEVAKKTEEEINLDALKQLFPDLTVTVESEWKKFGQMINGVSGASYTFYKIAINAKQALIVPGISVTKKVVSLRGISAAISFDALQKIVNVLANDVQ
jgi:hypothetical protein